MTHRKRRQAGVTIVELLIATVLIAIILLSIVPLFIASVKSNYSANEYTSIHNLARDRLEQLMNLPFNDPQLTAGAHDIIGATNPNGDLPSRLPDPVTGIPSLTAPRNPLVRSYTVQLFNSAPPATTGNAYTLTEVFGTGTAYDFKLINVTVTSLSSVTPFIQASTMGIGARTAQVSGIIRNLSPGFADPVAP
jgi:type II secretory pathway pseudopilin PulG